MAERKLNKVCRSNRSTHIAESSQHTEITYLWDSMCVYSISDIEVYDIVVLVCALFCSAEKLFSRNIMER